MRTLYLPGSGSTHHIVSRSGYALLYIHIYLFALSCAGSVTRRPRSGVWQFFRLKEPAAASAYTEFARPRDETARPRDETTRPRDETARPRDKIARPRDETARPWDETVRPRDESARPRAKCTLCGVEFVFHASTSSLRKHLLRYRTVPFGDSSI